MSVASMSFWSLAPFLPFYDYCCPRSWWLQFSCGCPSSMSPVFDCSFQAPAHTGCAHLWVRFWLCHLHSLASSSPLSECPPVLPVHPQLCSQKFFKGAVQATDAATLTHCQPLCVIPPLPQLHNLSPVLESTPVPSPPSLSPTHLSDLQLSSSPAVLLFFCSIWSIKLSRRKTCNYTNWFLFKLSDSLNWESQLAVHACFLDLIPALQLKNLPWLIILLKIKPNPSTMSSALLPLAFPVPYHGPLHPCTPGMLAILLLQLVRLVSPGDLHSFVCLECPPLTWFGWSLWSFKLKSQSYLLWEASLCPYSN